MAARHGHFMPENLLHSQFEALEEPGPDENAITVSIEPRPRAIVETILARLGLMAAAAQEASRTA
jgi:gluconate kinase